jgi:hypothetical protein
MLLVQLAQNLPDGHPWKSWLIIVAPPLSVALAGGWLWLRSQVQRWSDHRRTDGAFRELIRRREEELKRNMTPAERDEAEEALRQLRKDYLDWQEKRLKAQVQLLERGSTPSDTSAPR